MSGEKLLSRIWNSFSVFSALIGLASLSEAVIAWGDFVDTLLDGYQFLVYPIYDFIFSAFNFELSNFGKDYITCGLTISFCLYQASPDLEKVTKKLSFLNRLRERFLFSSLYCLLWPMFLIYILGANLYRVLNSKNKEIQSHKGLHEAKDALYWLCTIFVLFMMLLIVDSLLR